MDVSETEQIKNIKSFALQVRKNILDMDVSAGAGSAHFGGALSITEIVSTLFAHQMKIDKKNPHWEERDRFILSKGHACLGFYAILNELGFITDNEFGINKSSSPIVHMYSESDKEIAFKKGWIEKEELKNQAQKIGNTAYGQYLLDLTNNS